jgi:hypothetical protein
MRIEEPPDSIPKEVREYLVRMFKVIENEMRVDKQMSQNTRYNPSLYKPGMLRYFPNAVAGSPISSGGLWWYDGSWTKIV